MMLKVEGEGPSTVESIAYETEKKLMASNKKEIYVDCQV